MNVIRPGEPGFRQTRYYLQLELRGIGKMLTFRIAHREVKRFHRFVARNTEPMETGARFFVFTALHGYEVAVSVADIQSARVLWQRWRLDETDGDCSESDCIRVHLRGRGEIFETDAAEPCHIMGVVESLESNHCLERPFVSFLDEDGERTYFNTREIVLLLVPGWYRKWVMREHREEEVHQRKRAHALSDEIDADKAEAIAILIAASGRP